MSSRRTKTWKELLTEARGLSGELCDVVYRRTKLLAEIFSDQDWRNDVGLRDDFAAADWLDGEFRDLGLTFMQCRALLEEWPEAKRWKQGDLLGMWEELREKRRVADEERPKTKRTIVTKQMYADLEDEKEELEVRNRYLERELQSTHATVESELEQLRRRNRELEEQCATLRGRIQELERLLDRQEAAA